MHSSKGVSDSLKDSYLLDRPKRPKTASGNPRKGISGIKRPLSGNSLVIVCFFLVAVLYNSSKFCKAVYCNKLYQAIIVKSFIYS